MEVVSLIPFTDILKLVIAEAKKVKEFKPLTEDLASTIERLVPIFQEIDLLQKKLDPGNNDLTSLTKLLLRAKKIVQECSQVGVFSLVKKNSYTRKIRKINEDFVKFCQVDLQLIRHRNQLRSCSVTSLHIEESPPEHLVICESFNDEGKGKQVQEDEQLSVALQESLNMEELSSLEAEELESAIQESISFRHQQEEAAKTKISAQRKRMANGSHFDEDDEQRILWASLREKQDQEGEQLAVALHQSLSINELLFREAIEESISLCRQQEEQAAKRKLEEDEQISAQRKRMANGSSSSHGSHLDEEYEQRILWESLKEKQAQEGEQLAVALHQSLRINELLFGEAIQESISLCRQQDEQAAGKTKLEEGEKIVNYLLYGQRERITNGSCSSTRAPFEEDKQLILKVQEDEQVARALQESLNIEELSFREAMQESVSLHRQQEEKEAAKRKLEEDEQIAKCLVYDQRESIANGTSSSTRKKVQEDELVSDPSISIEEFLFHEAIQESIALQQREEHVTNRRARELYVESRRISNGLSTSSKALLDEDVQRILWESLKT